jgi:hypothetical protein
MKNRWQWIVSAQASGRADAPASVSELEQRVAKSAAAAKAQQDAEVRAREAMRKAATPSRVVVE